MAVLGVTEHRFLGYEDGTLADDDPEVGIVERPRRIDGDAECGLSVCKLERRLPDGRAHGHERDRRHHGNGEDRTRRDGHAREQSGGIRRRRYGSRQQHRHKSDHASSITSPGLAFIVRDWLDECAVRDRALGLACANFVKTDGRI
jgi:hypothetical protein